MYLFSVQLNTSFQTISKACNTETLIHSPYPNISDDAQIGIF